MVILNITLFAYTTGNSKGNPLWLNSIFFLCLLFFFGSWLSKLLQLGNPVPVIATGLLAACLCIIISEYVFGNDMSSFESWAWVASSFLLVGALSEIVLQIWKK